MLAGEYVVVERGTPSIAVAVEDRIWVEATPSDSGSGWTVTSERLGFVDEPLQKVPVLAEALARIDGAPPRGRLVVHSALGAGPDKPGLGSSAALCVAGFAALSQLVGRTAPLDLKTLIQVHRAAQGGLGSGYDVAAALEGGVTIFSPRGEGGPRLEKVSWPAGLCAAVFKASRGSSTHHMLRRVAAWREEDPETLDACLEPLAIETEELVAAFRRGDVEHILTAAAQVQEELAVMDRMGDLGIMAGGQLQLHGVIEDAGCVGRTSGAGGGDCVWALADDPQAIVRARANALELGFVALDVRFPGPGLLVETDGDRTR